MDTFTKYIDEGKTIIYLAGSSAASGIYQTANLVKNQIEGPLYIFDTYSLSVGSGMLVEEAAKMAMDGKSVDEIINRLDEMKANSHVYFSVDSLEYLYKGGRISSTKAAVGTLLNIKPILTIEDGLVKQKCQVRGSKKLIPSLIQMQIDDIGNDFSNIDIYVGHNDDSELTDTFVEKIKEKLNPRNIYMVQIGACVASHSGPDIMGLACICR
jgi:DegV family protein with EDD domain